MDMLFRDNFVNIGNGVSQSRPIAVYGTITEEDWIKLPHWPCGYDLKVMDGVTYYRPDTYSSLSPYDWRVA